jgi:serine/threonine protein kinase/regulator of sirC expression with transglutaminase-like and TPR domain
MKNRTKRGISGGSRPKKPPLNPKWRGGDLIRDRFEVYDIKAGGIGIVYIVFDHDDGVPYAIKTLQDRYLGDPVASERFVREAEVWVRLGAHQNIVRAFFVDRIDSQPCIFLECVVGSNLRRFLSRGPLPRRTVMRYAIQFCRAMVHARQKIPGFVHRDVKPENCMLTQDNTLKVTDFNLSKALFETTVPFGNSPQNGTLPGTEREKAAGTFPYMSPEQFLDFGGVGARSDIYSFGVMLYEMLTGKRPFSAETPPQWRDVHLKTKPMEPRSVVPSIPRGLNDLTMRCLAKKPAERPENFSTILTNMESMLAEEFGETIPSSTPEELESWEYSNKGVSLCNLGHVEEAIPCFDKALSIDARNFKTWANKAVAVGTLGRAEEELECYEKALAIAPDYAEAWYNKGLALTNLGLFEEAIDCYDHTLAINPHQAEVWVNKGSVLGTLGRCEEELSCYEKALTINPNHAGAWVNKASALINAGLYEEATKCCNKALALNPDLAEAWTNKASALGALNRFDETIRCCEKALSINPHLPEAWVSKGLALGALGRSAEEISCYEKALAINPDHPEALHRKELVLNSLHRFEEAISL